MTAQALSKMVREEIERNAIAWSTALARFLPFVISNYVMQQFGNPAVQVRAEDVATARKGGPAPPIALLSPCNGGGRTAVTCGGHHVAPAAQASCLTGAL
jgi:hypothetical protein